MNPGFSLADFQHLKDYQPNNSWQTLFWSQLNLNLCLLKVFLWLLKGLHYDNFSLPSINLETIFCLIWKVWSKNFISLEHNKGCWSKSACILSENTGLSKGIQIIFRTLKDTYSTSNYCQSVINGVLFLSYLLYLLWTMQDTWIVS